MVSSHGVACNCSERLYSHRARHGSMLAGNSTHRQARWGVDGKELWEPKPACDPVQTLVRPHAATHTPFPPEFCGHRESTPLGTDPGTNGLLTGKHSNCGHCCSNLCTTPVVSKSAKVHAAYTSLPPGLTAAAACRSFRC